MRGQAWLGECALSTGRITHCEQNRSVKWALGSSMWTPVCLKFWWQTLGRISGSLQIYSLEFYTFRREIYSFRFIFFLRKIVSRKTASKCNAVSALLNVTNKVIWSAVVGLSLARPIKSECAMHPFLLMGNECPVQKAANSTVSLRENLCKLGMFFWWHKTVFVTSSKIRNNKKMKNFIARFVICQKTNAQFGSWRFH